jgi:hypothetical protein
MKRFDEGFSILAGVAMVSMFAGPSQPAFGSPDADQAVARGNVSDRIELKHEASAADTAALLAEDSVFPPNVIGSGDGYRLIDVQNVRSTALTNDTKLALATVNTGPDAAMINSALRGREGSRLNFKAKVYDDGGVEVVSAPQVTARNGKEVAAYVDARFKEIEEAFKKEFSTSNDVTAITLTNFRSAEKMMRSHLAMLPQGQTRENAILDLTRARSLLAPDKNDITAPALTDANQILQNVRDAFQQTGQP